MRSNALQNQSLAFLCAETLYFAIPLLRPARLYSALPSLCLASLRPAFAVPCITPPCLRCALHHSALPSLNFHAVAFPGTSRRLVPMPSHRVALLLNASPSLCETSPSSSVASLRRSPLFHCVAEIRIAPQSLCCSSRPKTELSLAHAVLGCAALRLSADMLFNSLPFLCNAAHRGAART